MPSRLFVQRTVWFVATIGAIASWLQFLWPPFGSYIDRPDATLVSVTLELLRLRSAIYPDIPAGGYLFLALGVVPIVAAVYVAGVILRYIEAAYVGISVLETRLNLVLHDDGLTRASLDRRQLLHANRAGITAYHTLSSSNTPHGILSDDSISFDSYLNRQPVTKEVLKFGRRNNRELVETYTKPLPVNMFATLLPNRVVLWA